MEQQNPMSYQKIPPIKEHIPSGQPAQTLKGGGLPKWVIFVLVIILGLAVVGIGIGAYYYFTESDREHTIPDVTTSDATENNTSNETTDNDTSSETSDTYTQTEEEYKEWKTYENNENNIYFKYPSSWKVEEYSNSPLYFSVTASDNNNYSIRFYGVDDSYPYYCIYSDTDRTKIPEDPLGINREFSDYTEVKNSSVTYRRSKFTFENGSYELTVCKKKSNGLYKTGTIYIGYEVPLNPNKNKLSILDLILLSSKS